ncbi:MAG: cupin domain-containing protein [Longimicrobiales bacterium]
MRIQLVLGVACLAAASAAQAQIEPHPQAIVVHANSLEWGPAPASLPAGARAAVIEGDPSKAGLFTMRLSLPAGYRIAPHHHPVWEHVTVLEGSFNVGMGEKVDASGDGVRLTAGSFGALPPGMRHYAWTTEPTVLQLHAEGPWRLVYVDPADDPRSKK